MAKRILIIEDDKAIARLLRDNLEYEGFVVETCDNGHDALPSVKRFTPDLLLLDLMLPHGADGFDICRALHESPTRVPVIILSARAQKEDRIRGLTLGADDYVTKPFALDELLARVHAVLRRTKPPIEQLRLGKTVIDFKRLKAYCGTKTRRADRPGVRDPALPRRTGRPRGDAGRAAAPGVGLLGRAAHAHRGQLHLPAAPQAGTRSAPSHLHPQGLRRRLPADHRLIAGAGAHLANPAD